MQVSGLTWGDWDEPIFDLHPHIILGADVLYDSASELLLYSTMFSELLYFLNVDNCLVAHSFIGCLFPLLFSSFGLSDTTLSSIWQDFDNLFATVTFLLENSPGSVFITTYHNRRYQVIISYQFHLDGVHQATFLINQLDSSIYAVVIIWSSFLWSSGVWNVRNCWMVSPSSHHARLLHYRGTFSLLKLCLTRKNINDTKMS